MTDFGRRWCRDSHPPLPHGDAKKGPFMVSFTAVFEASRPPEGRFSTANPRFCLRPINKDTEKAFPERFKATAELRSLTQAQIQVMQYNRAGVEQGAEKGSLKGQNGSALPGLILI